MSRVRDESLSSLVGDQQQHSSLRVLLLSVCPRVCRNGHNSDLRPCELLNASAIDQKKNSSVISPHVARSKGGNIWMSILSRSCLCVASVKNWPIKQSNISAYNNSSSSMETVSGIPEEVPQDYKDKLGALQKQIKILLQNHQVWWSSNIINECSVSTSAQTRSFILPDS